MNLESLRKMRKTDFSSITAAFEKENNNTTTKSYKDDRFWKLSKDKAGNGSAVIRFLPKMEEDEAPWVKILNYGFQGPSGKYYIENSLKTIGLPDPLHEFNGRLWNSGQDQDKEQYRKQKARTQYTSNILVISDSTNPDNNGKVFLFQYGKKIHDMICDKAFPIFEGDDPVDVFHLWEGCNFRLRIRMDAGWPTFDKSTFDTPSELFDGDEEKLLETIKKQVLLKEFLEPANFKTYEELAKHLMAVLNTEAALTPSAMALSQSAEYAEPKSAPAPVIKSAEAKLEVPEDDADILDYFKNLSL